MHDPRPDGARVTTAMCGSTTPPHAVAWEGRDVMLYALGVGAGVPDPAQDLHLTTENSRGVALQVLPSFLSTFPLGHFPPALSAIDRGRLLHGAQEITLGCPLPVAGQGHVTTTISGVYDKGAHAVIVQDTQLTFAGEDSPIGHSRATLFIRGGGGFGGPRGPKAPQFDAVGAPDHTITLTTRPEQPLIYRLSGDRNPLHSDPVFARDWGFDRPILHGLCTYGFATRALARALCDGDTCRLSTITARFRAPVLPGATLTFAIWRGALGEAQWSCTDDSGANVVDYGTARFTPITRETYDQTP